MSMNPEYQEEDRGICSFSEPTDRRSAVRWKPSMEYVVEETQETSRTSARMLGAVVEQISQVDDLLCEIRCSFGHILTELGTTESSRVNAVTMETHQIFRDLVNALHRSKDELDLVLSEVGDVQANQTAISAEQVNTGVRFRKQKSPCVSEKNSGGEWEGSMVTSFAPDSGEYTLTSLRNLVDRVKSWWQQSDSQSAFTHSDVDTVVERDMCSPEDGYVSDDSDTTVELCKDLKSQFDFSLDVTQELTISSSDDSESGEPNTVRYMEGMNDFINDTQDDLELLESFATDEDSIEYRSALGEEVKAEAVVELGEGSATEGDEENKERMEVGCQVSQSFLQRSRGGMVELGCQVSESFLQTQTTVGAENKNKKLKTTKAKRRGLKWEIFQREKSYCDGLWNLVENVYEPLRDSKIIPEKDLKRLFPDELFQIYKHQSILRDRLEVRLIRERGCIANVYLNVYEPQGELFGLYVKYAVVYAEDLPSKYFGQWGKVDEYFKRRSWWNQLKTDIFAVREAFSKPQKKITQDVLLFKELVKTAHHHCSHESILRKVKKDLKNLGREMNAERKKEEERRKEEEEERRKREEEEKRASPFSFLLSLQTPLEKTSPARNFYPGPYDCDGKQCDTSAPGSSGPVDSVVVGMGEKSLDSSSAPSVQDLHHYGSLDLCPREISKRKKAKNFIRKQKNKVVRNVSGFGSGMASLFSRKKNSTEHFNESDGSQRFSDVQYTSCTSQDCSALASVREEDGVWERKSSTLPQSTEVHNRNTSRSRRQPFAMKPGAPILPVSGGKSSV